MRTQVSWLSSYLPQTQFFKEETATLYLEYKIV